MKGQRGKKPGRFCLVRFRVSRRKQPLRSRGMNSQYFYFLTAQGRVIAVSILSVIFQHL